MHVVGRVVTVVMTCLGIMWIPVVHASSSGLYVYTHKVMAYMAPPVTVVFVAGVFWPRANSRGAAACFAYGLVVGQARLVLELLVPRSPANNLLVTSFCHSNFLHFAAGFGGSCAAVLICVSVSSGHVCDGGDRATECAGRRAGSASPVPSVRGEGNVELNEISTTLGESRDQECSGEGVTGVVREEMRTRASWGSRSAAAAEAADRRHAAQDDLHREAGSGSECHVVYGQGATAWGTEAHNKERAERTSEDRVRGAAVDSHACPNGKASRGEEGAPCDMRVLQEAQHQEEDLKAVDNVDVGLLRAQDGLIRADEEEWSGRGKWQQDEGWFCNAVSSTVLLVCLLFLYITFR